MEEKKTKSVSQIMRAIRGKESQTKASHKLKTTVTTISRIETSRSPVAYWRCAWSRRVPTSTR